jgi:perosamine synthetase
VDVLGDSWCVDPARVEQAITSRTKAIIAVHLYGNTCEMEALLALGERHGVAVIEDAAEAIGSRRLGQPVGSMGTFGTFSFHGTKTLTTGEGGMFVTNDDALHERVSVLANHGRAPAQTKQFWPDTIGYKYKMSNVEAAIGCAQVDRLPELVASKRRIFDYYAGAFADLPLTMNPEPEGTVNGFWMPTIVAHPGLHFDRDELLAAFKAANIDARVFFWPLSMLPMFESKPSNVVSYSLCRRAINLPSYHDLTEAEMDRVIGVVRAHVPRVGGITR